jgi:hypothetical protein
VAVIGHLSVLFLNLVICLFTQVQAWHLPTC